MRRCSVIINTYNRAPSLRLTLEGLQHLEHPCFEVVVVNGPSTDSTDDVLAEWDGRIKVVRTPERNLSVSRNLGIRAAAGEVVAFIDDDAYPDPSWLDHLAAAHDDDEVVAAGGPVLDHTGARWQARYSMANRSGDAWTTDGPNPTGLFGSPFSDEFVYPMGTNSSFRREALVAIGGFDEEYEFYLDETDVAVRLLDRGLLVAALDDGVVYHKFLASEIRTAKRATRNRYSVAKNRLYFALRHGRQHHTIAELLEGFDAFVEHHRRDYRWNIDNGLLEESDLEQFERDVERATDLAIARAGSGEPHTRPSSWFDVEPEPFLAFPTLRPAGRRLRLAVLSQEYPPGPINGIGRFAHVLATELGRRGHEVHVVTRGAEHDRVDLEEHVWVHRVAVQTHPLPDGLRAGPGVPAHIWDYAASVAHEVRRIDRRRSLDLVQFPNWDVEGLAVVLDGDFPTVLSLHTPLRKVIELDASVSIDDPIVRQIGAVEREVYGLVTAYLANGPSVVAEIQRCYGVRLPPASIFQVPHGMPDATAASAKPTTTGTGAEILFVGRLEHRKGIDTLLDAVPLVLAARADARFTVVGDDGVAAPDGPPYRARFDAANGRTPAGASVRFLGRVDDATLEHHYATCDVLVAPSRYESFGLVLLEAMRHGKPVIAGDVGGMRDIVDGNGLLVPPGDPEALASALLSMLSDAENREELGRRSRELFTTRYSAARMADEVEAAYLALVADGPAEAEGAVPRADAGRRLGIDLADRLRCPDCGSPVRVVANVVTADGLCKRGSVVCEACDLAVAAIHDFVYDFHARQSPPTETIPVVVPALGERRLGADDLAPLMPVGWLRHERFVFADGAPPGLVVDVRATDLSVRMLHHRWSGIVELVLDGRVVDEVDLFLADGALVHAHPVLVDAPFGHHTIEIRPTGLSHPAAEGRQVLVEEIVAFGPLRRGLGFQLPAPLNRGNPESPNILRYLDALPPDAWVLECGGGDRRASRPNHVNFEYLAFELADVLGDIHHLPFADDAFDFVFSQAVFEHVRNPFEAARELVRVTRPGGLIVTEVAFLQPLHAVPYHYFNMTQWGAEELFADCEIIQSDWFGELSETVDWYLRSANLDATAPKAKLASVRRTLRELDEHVSHEDLRPVASAVYVVARKPR